MHANGCRQRGWIQGSVPRVGLPLLPLVALRVMRRWNQTGQKHTGSPDIAKQILPYHSQTLWLLVLLTYIGVVGRLSKYALPGASRVIAMAASTLLGIASLAFKIAFTCADAPELLGNFKDIVPDIIAKSSLVYQARIVYLLALLILSMTLALSRTRFSSEAHLQNGTVILSHTRTMHE